MNRLSKDIFDLAEKRSAGQPYPVYVNNLLGIGVKSYTVSVRNHQRSIYSSADNAVLEIAGNGQELECAADFNEAALITALHRTQAGESDYPTFLAEIEEAGVHFYTADLLNRTVTYYGKDRSNQYAEKVPDFLSDSIVPAKA